ncbi:hypothetical protein HORIV_70140 [Vreelandella olivaria]|uniref:Uncharacterized protein n=1 Tax=Vreelandella olivaria TaxID=390919 RepID=A0ABN5X5V1_9GAMM|nr:hypothetical protein HORIV_70140 [Halomonas olivaria]
MFVMQNNVRNKNKEASMSQPCIICVAITGSLPRKENNPAVPITVEEQIESTQAAFEAGLPSPTVMCATMTKPPPLTQKSLAA